MTRLLPLLALLLSACSEGWPPPAAERVEAPPEPACARMFSVEDPSLAPLVEQAAERWSLGTGCPITVAEGGMPVVLVGELLTAEGERANGRARVFSTDGAFDHCEGLILSATSADPARTVAHEMGHCLGARAHAPGGLMAERPSPGALIDAEALGLVCGTLGCPEGGQVAE